MARTYRRRRVLAGIGAVAAGWGAGCLDDADGAPGGPTGDAPVVGLEAVATGFRAPVDIVFTGDERRYVADQSGRVHVHGPDGLRDEPLLDLRDAVTYGGEKGLLGVALHPSFPDDPRLFVRYSAPRRSGTPQGYSHTFVLASFAVGDDGLRARRGTEETLLEIPQPQANHNSGDLAFGPDGHLYVGVGDGGAGGDRGRGHVEDWYVGVDGGNGQDVTENLLGSILRLDVDDASTGPSDRPYGVPSDNPLVGRAGRDEHYAWGLRNPWRFSIDPAGDLVDGAPDLYVGDVGQNAYEEVDLVAPGGNYGWNVREGRHCYGAADCPTATPADVRGGERLREPIVEYPHDGGVVNGISVIGGYRYRGERIDHLAGDYLFGDLDVAGRLFAASPPESDGTAGGRGDDGWLLRPVPIASDDAEPPGRLLSFGRDPDGALYLLGTGRGGGGVYRIVAP